MKNRFLQVAFLVVLALIAASPAFGANLIIEHELGTISLGETPEKIVVFDYGVLDVLDFLGIDVAGVPTSSLPVFLEHYQSYPDVGTLFEPDFEAIYRLKPDLIIISGRQAEQYHELSRIAPTLYVDVDNADYWGSVKSNLTLLGQIFVKDAELQRVIAELEEGIAAIEKQAVTSGLTTLILMANDGALSVYGATSRFGIIHQAFGFLPVDEKIETATHGQNISYEYLVRTNPDVIFVIDRVAVAGGSVSAKQVLNNPLVKLTKAAQEDRIIYLDPHAWYVVSGGITSTKIMIEDVEQLFR